MFSMKEKQSRPITDFNQASIGMALPVTSLSMDNPIIGTKAKPIVVRKDGAEILSFTYVLEFVSNKRNYVLGSALARNCPLVSGSDARRTASLYVLPQRISKFATIVSLDGAIKLRDYSSGSIVIGEYSIKFVDEISSVAGSAWAIVNNASGELLIGSNEIIEAGQTIQLPTLTLKHNIY